MEASLALADLLYKVGSADAASKLLLGRSAQAVGPSIDSAVSLVPLLVDVIIQQRCSARAAHASAEWFLALCQLTISVACLQGLSQGQPGEALPAVMRRAQLLLQLGQDVSS